MKFVFFGYDFMMPALRRLLDDGHELMSVFTFDCDNLFNFNHEILALADELGIPAHTQKPHKDQIDSLIANRAECFLAAGYPYKIPPIAEDKAYAVNCHPSHLPKGRGLMPTPYIILGAEDAAGFSVHKMTQVIDGGDILAQVKFTLDKRETVETYSARVAMAAPDIISRIMADLPKCWQDAKPQDENEITMFPQPDDALRTLEWSKSVEEIDKTARAFGHFGVLVNLQGKTLVTSSCVCWKEDHNHAAGHVVLEQPRSIIVAASDGFVCLNDCQLLQQHA